MDSEADVRSSLRGLQLAGPDMLIDGYEQYNHQIDETVDIRPDDHSEEATDAPIRADDCMSGLLPKIGC
jgi:hypothetical protein